MTEKRCLFPSDQDEKLNNKEFSEGYPVPFFSRSAETEMGLDGPGGP
jgi:hypothetical protein